jgi:hypothetical protein
MLLRNLIAPLLIILTSYGCDTLKNRTDSIALECGLDQKSVGQNSYLKLLNSQGTGYEAADLPALKSQFRTGEGETKPLPMTSRGCVILPRDAGLLQVLDSRNSESLTLNIGPGAPKREFQTLNLKSKPDIQLRLACPAEGIFASENFPQPLFINSNGDIAGLDFRLELLNLDNELIRTLYHKPKGSTELLLPETFDIRDITEGTYALKVYGHHLSQGIDSRPQLLSSEKPCILNVLHGTVYVGGFEPDTKQIVYPTRARLPWTIKNPFENLFVCKEKRSLSDRGAEIQSASCKPQSNCLDSTEYKESAQVITESVGVFDYFVYAENRAGRKSDLKCQTIIVSDAPPALSVNWAHDDIKKPGSILRKPYAILKANIETQHGLIASDSIKDNLTCKVDFEIKGKNTFSEKGVTCTEGRCAGKSLSDFVPCDKEVAFTIVDALNQPMLLNSRLRLTVRASDGAGHISEAQASVWINQTIWARETLSYSVGETTLSLAEFQIDPSGDILGKFSDSRLASFYSGRWFELKPDETRAFDYKFGRSRDGAIRIARLLRYDEQFKVDIFAYDRGSLTPIALTKDDNKIPSCTDLLIGPQDNFFCVGTKIDTASQLTDKTWTRLPQALDPSDLTTSRHVTWRILANGDVAATSKTDIFIWNGKTWTRRPILSDKAFESEPDLIEDFKGGLWIYARPKEGEYGLYKLTPDGLVLFPSPAPLTQLFKDISRPTSSEGLSYFLADLYSFNFSTETWEVNYPIHFSPDAEARQPIMNGLKNPMIILGNQGFFEKSTDMVYWPTKSMGYEADSPGQSIQLDRNAYYFIDSSKSDNMSHLVRIKPSFVSTFDSSMTGSSDVHATGAWQTADGRTVFTFWDGTQLEVAGDRIEKKRTPEPFKEALQVFALDSGGYCIARMSGYWIYKPAQNIYKNIATDEGSGRQQQCTEDNAGRIWWIDQTMNSLNFHQDDRSQVYDLSLNEGEKVINIRPTGTSARILVATNQRVFLIANDGLIAKSWTRQDISPGVPAVAIQSAVKLSDQEILVSAVNSANQKIFLNINLETGASIVEAEFKRLVGEFGVLRSTNWQGVTYILTSSPRAVFLQRAGGKWKKFGANINDYKHAFLNKASTPWWFAADTSGRLWFIASPSPYTFGRVDPDLAP